MSIDWSDALEAASGDLFDEIPVDAETFVSSPDYMNFPPISNYQLEMIKASTQIYFENTLYEFLEPEEARKRWSQTFNEAIVVWGKGAGKDAMSELACCYIVYQIMCLKDPQGYFNKPPGDYIDIMNIALNAQQANNVFFKGLKQRLKNAPWFEGKYDPKQGEIEFDKSIRIISGHSESESLEGYNVIACFAKETKILTSSGFMEIGGLVDREVEILTKNAAGDAEWRYAPINSFGMQKLMKITLASHRRKSEKVIYATPEHKWFVKTSPMYPTPGFFPPVFETKTTAELEPEDRLNTLYPSGQMNKNWWVVSVEETDRYEEVFCATVEGTQNFVIDGYIWTSNCVLDEIAGFDSSTATGVAKKVTAESTYKMHRASVSSRFGRHGKMILLSFPRHKTDYIMQKYDDAIAEKIVEKRSHTFYKDPELPPNTPGNDFTIEWNEDHILSYKAPGIYAIKRPSWEVNPTKDIEDYQQDFFLDTPDAMGRFAADPPDMVNAFFHSLEAIDEALSGEDGVTAEGQFLSRFKPDPTKEYYMHVDLAEVHDRCVVSMAHVESFKQTELFGQRYETHPFVVVDCIRAWFPTANDPMDFAQVREFILDVRSRGFNIRKVSFDQWQSRALMEELENRDIDTERQAINDSEYTDFKLMVHAQEVQIPRNMHLREEMIKLTRNKKGKIMQPPGGHNDHVDAVAGATLLAVKHTDRNFDQTIEVFTPRQLAQRDNNREKGRPKIKNIIEAPRADMPEEIKDFLAGFKFL